MGGGVLLTRRGLLQAGLLGSAAVWAGGQLGCAARRVAPAASAMPRLALSPAGEAIMRAVMPVVLGPLLPADGEAREQALDGGMASLDEYLASLSLPLQAQAGDVFETLDLLPVRVAVVGTWSSWPEVAPAMVESFLHAARQSRFDLLRRMYVFLQSMAVLAWFDQPAAWPAIGYPGPPLTRDAAGEGAA
ncbi:MAG TPA: hypothetical protein VL049_19555 [Candidatus Dormibacteraeota bacterium]|nr:hypothetical protein [Candidatus Dormibacteraeota bacterium]